MQIDHIFGWLIITDQDIITVLLSSPGEVSESGGDVLVKYQRVVVMTGLTPCTRMVGGSSLVTVSSMLR